MAIGCLTAFAGAGSLWPEGQGLDLMTLVIVAPPTILGGYFGSRCTGRFRKESLQFLVGCTVALTGLGMAGHGLWELVAA
jgi:uncharacterized membrane protein YfcA